MKLRLSGKVDLKVDFPEKITEFQIPPLLFVPFIENAFKHGVSYREKSFVHIALQANGGKIIFHCSNRINRRGESDLVENHSGIGLENVKKRLNLLFPENHTLKIDHSGDTFDVSVEIEIKEQP
jgi:two-component system, LytTR family, sensor kinase